jgi:hypothetical protein
MHLVWFRPALPSTADALDDTAQLIDRLRSRRHDVRVVTDPRATGPSAGESPDLMVFELDDDPAHEWIWSLARRTRGVVRLRSIRSRESHSVARTALLTLVSHPAIAEDLCTACPDIPVRVVTTGVGRLTDASAPPRTKEAPVVLGLFPSARAELVRRVLARAGLAEPQADLLTDPSPARVLLDSDILLALRWPWFGEPLTEALAGMAAQRAVVVLETAGSADWPALDPQTWRSRGAAARPPIVVSVDPLDEEHSLTLTVKRLVTDTSLRHRLRAAGFDWWNGHATPAHAVDDWERALHEACERSRRSSATSVPRSSPAPS